MYLIGVKRTDLLGSSCHLGIRSVYKIQPLSGALVSRKHSWA
jgi:hypothetical protein